MHNICLGDVKVISQASTSTMRKIFIPKLTAILLFVFGLVIASGEVYAQEAPTPDMVQVSTPVYQPAYSEFAPEFGTYTYTVSWQGIPAATLKFSCAPDGLYYRMVATAQTWSGVDLVYKMRYRAEGSISAIDFLPVKTTIQQKENSRQKYTEIDFKGDGEVYAYRKTNEEEPKQLLFKPDNFMLDPFSAAFIARSLHWEVGETKEFDTFNGKSRYLISLTATEKTVLRYNGEDRDVFVIVPRVTNLVNQQQSKKLRAAKIYLTADSKREIIKLVSEVFIGSVTTSMDSFEPLPNARAGMTLASSIRDTSIQ